jgi:phospholipase C
MTESTKPSAFSRRNLLKGAAGLGVAAAASVFLPPNIRKALASPDLPKFGEGSIDDIEHIVFLMQENRSFDEYFGTFPGVRGFGDPNAMTLPNGNSVFEQPDPGHADGYVLPFWMDSKTTSAQQTPGMNHSWEALHEAWDNGAMDNWIPAQGTAGCMGYFKQPDIPFHWALAEAFTICDAYHHSILGPTDPNRLYMWTGWIDPNNTSGSGPALDNSMAYNNPYLTWTTYPERLTAAGITWRIYQEYDNYDDNGLAWFQQYANADHDSPLWQNAMIKKPAGWFEEDAVNDNLPQVSWLVAPSSQSEHPNWSPAAGAQYIASKIDAIAANPKVWAKTAFILMYDECDGRFDHVLPPTPSAGTADEFVTLTSPGGTPGNGWPIGLAFRVPCIIVSPWTVGGYVATETFDHTSLIQFVEQRFAVMEPNISAWRRQTCGDLTSAFQFSYRQPFPDSNVALSVPSTTVSLLAAQQEIANNPAPEVPAVNTPPVQDAATRTNYLRPGPALTPFVS